MATYGTEKVLAGTRHVRYTDPKIKGTANQFGLYQWSAFEAQLISGLSAGGAAIPLDDVPTGTAVSALVFTSDIPVVAGVTITDETANLQYRNVCANVLTTNVAVSTSGGATNATIPEVGQVLTGYTGTGNAVPVTGFPLGFVVITPGTAGASDRISLDVVANGAVINGVIGGLRLATTTAPSPVLLKYSAYTQAIKDNNNILQLNSAAPQYQVVGLYR